MNKVCVGEIIDTDVGCEQTHCCECVEPVRRTTFINCSKWKVMFVGRTIYVLIHNRFSSHTILGMAVLSSSFSSARCECAMSCPVSIYIFYLRQLYESDPRQTTDATAPLTSDELQFFPPFRSTCVIQLIAVVYKHYSEAPRLIVRLPHYYPTAARFY